jgi:hypothetical protein
LRRAAALAFAGLLGCVSPVELDHAVLEYDRAVNRVEAELLLLNIARARHHRPIHFTAVSSIAATYDFRLDAAAVGRFGPSPDDAPADVLFGASFAENPTITIVPISGQEFTTRVLRPLEEAQFQLLVQQDFPLDIGGAAARARGVASLPALGASLRLSALLGPRVRRHARARRRGGPSERRSCCGASRRPGSSSRSLRCSSFRALSATRSSISAPASPPGPTAPAR